MTNALVPQYHAQLPAFLRDPALFQATDDAIAGIGGGMPPYISIRGAKFHLVGADGEEAQVNQLTIDVIVLSGNEHVSKSYYAGAYDPAAGGGVAPTCFSDNGLAPSALAASPQHPTCAGCEKGAWGSKVTPTGSQVKACTDSKKLAVVLASDTPIIINGAASVAKAYEQVWLLRVPAASMRGWRDYAKEIRGRGVPIIGVVSRLAFDSKASYPALLFSAVSFVPSEDVFKKLVEKRDQPTTAEAIGMNDLPLQSATAALPQTAPSHLRLVQEPAVVAAPAQIPTVFTPAQTIPQQQIIPVAPSAAPVEATSTARRRGRPPAQSAAAPTPSAPPATPAPAAPLFAAPPAGNGSVIQQPQASDASLDALLARALGPQ